MHKLFRKNPKASLILKVVVHIITTSLRRLILYKHTAYGVGKGLQPLKGYSAHLNEQKCLLTCVQKPAPAEKLAYWEQRNKIPEPVCEELQLLMISVFPLSGEFFSHSTRTTPRECTSSLLAICKDIVLPVASCKLCCKHTVCSEYLVTDEVRFTRDGTVNFHDTHVCVEDNPHTTVPSRR